MSHVDRIEQQRSRGAASFIEAVVYRVGGWQFVPSDAPTMGQVLTYRLLLLLKLVGVIAFAGGMITATVATSLADRRRAVHVIASPAMVIVWIAGGLLARRTSVPLSSAWIVGGFTLSLVSLLALIAGAAREPRRAAGVITSHVAFWTALVLMVLRPSW